MTRRRRVARRPRRPARRTRLWKKTAALAAVGVAMLAASVAAFLVLSPSSEPPGPPKAAIVDQLSLTFPNADFVREATATLEQAGYVVDYYPGEEVTVDFYRRLAEQNHELVIFRVHGGQTIVPAASGEILGTYGAGLFTAEPYDPQKYVDEQRALRLSVASYEVYGANAPMPENRGEYFGINPDFIASSISGRFDDAIIVLMGCEVLTNTVLAQAFIDKGAKAVVGWDGTVSAVHTDATTLSMLKHLLLEDISPQQAAEVAMAEVGPDPFFDSVLVSYPPGG